MNEPRKSVVGTGETARKTVSRRRAPEKPGAPAEVQAQLPVAPAKPAGPVIGGIEVGQAASLAPSAALVAVGLLLESELLVGIAIGTGIALAASWAPEPISGAVLPMVNTTVKACYSAAATMAQMLGDAIEGIEGAIIGIGGAPKEPEAREAVQPTPSEASANTPNQAIG
jgi:hypothetical protein